MSGVTCGDVHENQDVVNDIDFGTPMSHVYVYMSA